MGVNSAGVRVFRRRTEVILRCRPTTSGTSSPGSGKLGSFLCAWIRMNEEANRGRAADRQGANDNLPTEIAPVSETSRSKSTLGPYHLLEKIGEGGMGEVWLAEQKSPVRRRVAVKLIKDGVISREASLRFESERQALALMDHPAIAKVYDAGTTPDGKPYFVMEFVSGVAISDYCESHKLSTRERLELFIHVCEGVQHAHQKAIIHRDLKPSNILVSSVDGKPAPKIIDFGVAKALSHNLTEQTIFTRIGSIIGTPEYMSPEQASSGGEDIDTRTDVYSLGVILYELLTGVPPLDLRGTSYFELVRKIRETDTPKPSTKLRMLAAAAGHSTGERGPVTALLAREVRGDLDCITLKCLEKDRTRRYGSPSEISADITRYLHDEPVLAAPPSVPYRLQKFARRNRGLLAAVCAMLFILAAGTFVSIYQAIRARKAERLALLQRDRADSAAQTARGVNEFLLSDLLSQAGVDQTQNPDAAPDPDIRVRTLVERAAAAAGKKFAGKPTVEADVRKTLGETYLSLGLLKQAEEQLRQAYELNRRARGEMGKETIDSLQSLGAVEFNAFRYSEAARHQELAVNSARSAFGPENRLTLTALQSLAVDYMMMGHPEKAEPLLKQTLQAQIKAIGYDDADTLNTSDSLATLYLQDGRYSQAEQLLERGLQSYKKLFGPEHPSTMREIFGLVRVRFRRGEYASAEPLAASVYESNRRLLGPSHFKTRSSAMMLARIYAENGKLPEAEKLAKDTVDGSIASEANDSGHARDLLAEIYEKRNQYGKAEPLRRELESTADRVYRDSPSDAISTRQALGNNLLHQRRCAEAEPYLQEANRRWNASSLSDWRRFEAQAILGEALVCQSEFDRGKALLLSGYEGLKQHSQNIPANEQYKIKEAADELARLHKSE